MAGISARIDTGPVNDPNDPLQVNSCAQSKNSFNHVIFVCLFSGACRCRAKPAELEGDGNSDLGDPISDRLGRIGSCHCHTARSWTKDCWQANPVD